MMAWIERLLGRYKSVDKELAATKKELDQALEEHREAHEKTTVVVEDTVRVNHALHATARALALAAGRNGARRK
jgi:hypothetical protein